MSLIERIYKRYYRPHLFAATSHDAELAHQWGLEQLMKLQKSPLRSALADIFLTYPDPILETKVCGIKFSNPFGLAAGYDKYCQVYWGGIPLCGWGFTEVGGITMRAQLGNPRPRMQRSLEHLALWNAMGFNNPGAEDAAIEMATNPPVRNGFIVGANLGKSATTPIDEAGEDYAYSIKLLFPFVRFFTVNISSPNTVGLRQLQQRDFFENLMRDCQQANETAARQNVTSERPLGIKLSPDESDETIADIISICRRLKISFIIATNTTLSRDHCRGWDIPSDRGGVSGQPLSARAKDVLRSLRQELQGEIPLIGVGGIASGDDLYERITLGADLTQAFTAWPFEGPDFVRRSLKRLTERLRRDGHDSVSTAVGTAV